MTADPAAHLSLDWNGTVVDDVGRAVAATAAVVGTAKVIAEGSGEGTMSDG